VLKDVHLVVFTVY